MMSKYAFYQLDHGKERWKEAFLSDESAAFRTPVFCHKQENVTVTMRVPSMDVYSVKICFGTSAFFMTEIKREELFYYFSYTFSCVQETISYYMEIQTRTGTFYYHRAGLTEEVPQTGLFQIIPEYFVPDWAKGAVMYQIFTDRYCNGDPTNDVRTGEYSYCGRLAEGVQDWNSPIQTDDFCRFYGGDLAGIIAHLDDLKKLGVEALYLNPIFVSPSNHKYDTQDYSHVDPHYGKIVQDDPTVLAQPVENIYAKGYRTRTCNQENLDASDAVFAQLVEKAHEKGIRVILDGVFNHCGGFHWWLDKEGIYGKSDGAYWNPNSPYRPFFYWTGEKTYEGWWGYDNHPKLAYEDCPALQEYMMKIATKWLSPPFCADGWRLDVAADLGKSEAFNHVFWKKFHEVVRQAKGDALILAEHYGSPQAWLNGEEWDSVMNYDAFMEPVGAFFTGVNKHSTELLQSMKGNGASFWQNIKKAMANMPYPAQLCAMNQLSNHDHSRFLTRTNGKVGRLHTEGRQAAEEGISLPVFRQAVLFQMTWIGSPAIYYGDESGLCGWTDPDNRRPYPWGKEDQDLISFHRFVIGMRKEHIALQQGTLIPLTGEENLIAFARVYEEETFIVLFYTGDVQQTVTIPIWKSGCEQDVLAEIIFTTDANGFRGARKLVYGENGFVAVSLAPHSGMVLHILEHQDNR